MFCSVSKSMGRSCEDSAPAPLSPEPSPPSTTEAPQTVIGGARACSETWGRVARGKNDPRPPIRADYCRNETRTVGRDCYFWDVQDDPVTGQARWMRKGDPDDMQADMKYGGSCEPAVKCPNFIDPKLLEGYTDVNAAALLKQCTAVSTSASSKDATIAEITKAAKSIRSWSGTEAWADVHSRAWFTSMARYIQQKDLKAYIDNATTATKKLMDKLTTTAIRKSTFAYILEAALRSPDNRSDWIIDTTNGWINKVTPPGRSERGFIAYLRGILQRPPMARWEAIIDNPRLYR